MGHVLLYPVSWSACDIVEKLMLNLIWDKDIFIEENVFKICLNGFLRGHGSEWINLFSPLDASVNYVVIGSGNGLVPFRHQAITWTNADLLSVGSYEQTSVKI